jgi:hypothetical protein
MTALIGKPLYATWQLVQRCPKGTTSHDGRPCRQHAEAEVHDVDRQ